jgi:hypothetical protein
VNSEGEQNDDGEDEATEDDTDNPTTPQAPRKNGSLDSLPIRRELRKRRRPSNEMEESDEKLARSRPKLLRDTKRGGSVKPIHPAKRRKASNGRTILATPSEHQSTSKNVPCEVIIIDYVCFIIWRSIPLLNSSHRIQKSKPTKALK